MKLFLLLICLHTALLPAVAQQPRKLSGAEALKKKLPSLSGSEKLECLYQIVSHYYTASNVYADSTLAYAKQATDYAQLINDKKGLFGSAVIYGRSLLQLSRADEGLQYYRMALEVAKELKSDPLKATAYRGIGQSLWYQGNFQKSVDTIKLSIIYFQKSGNMSEVSDAKMVISNIYGDQGNYEEAFKASLEALELSENLGDQDNAVLSLAQVGELYKNIGDYQTALDYFHRAFNYEPDDNSWSYRHLSNSAGDLYCEMKKYDSAYIFYQQALAGHKESKTTRLRLAEYYLLRKSYDTSFAYFNGLYDELKNSGEANIFINSLLGMGQIHYANHDLAQAMIYARQAYLLSDQKGTKKIIRDASRLLSLINEEQNQTDSAFFYFKKYVAVKDSIITDQFKGKLFAFQRANQNENERKQIETLKEQKVSSRRFTKVLVGVILLLALLTFIIYRNSKLRRKNQTLQTASMEAEWQRRASELEMQALRAQMNPHFIFNCLSSINKFILKNEPDKASDYLTRFSRLIRLVLLNSQKPLIVLEDEVEMLRLYIEMEKLRFKNSFDYTITYTHDIEPSNIYIPPLLLQPFCENAIWHGLMHKEGFGHLDIFFEKENKMIICTITDNGIGRAKASEIKTKSAERIKSLGLKLTSERLALFNEGKSVQTFYKMEDVMEEGAVAGTRVKINIKYKEGVEETVQEITND